MLKLHRAYSIQGCNQTRPTYFQHRALLSTSFKSALIDFLAHEIRSHHYKDIINEETVFFAWKQSCIKFQEDNNEVIISGVDELSCPHNEADTRTLLYASYAAENTSNPHIAVHSSDTDIFILLLHFASQLDVQIWMYTGISSLNTRRNIDISNMANALGSIVCAALPGFHSFTGSDISTPLLDWVSQTLSATLEYYVCAPTWSAAPIHQMLMQRDTK